MYCENADSDPILGNNNFPDNHDQKVTGDLKKMDIYLGRNFFTFCYILKHTYILFLLDIHFI